MKALSIKQPWAWAILNAGKDVENRTWHTNLRGRIQVHAGKSIDKNGLRFLRDMGVELPDSFVTGAIVGEVDITDSVDASSVDSPWAFGPVCFKLSNPEPYSTPIPYKGQLGFFTPDVVRDQE